MSNHSRLLGHIAPVLQVKDMARSLAFYRVQLGFKLEFLQENFYASVVRTGCHFHLQCGTPAEHDRRHSSAMSTWMRASLCAMHMSCRKVSRLRTSPLLSHCAKCRMAQSSMSGTRMATFSGSFSPRQTKYTPDTTPRVDARGTTAPGLGVRARARFCVAPANLIAPAAR